jgi:hypothetical protein
MELVRNVPKSNKLRTHYESAHGSGGQLFSVVQIKQICQTQQICIYFTIILATCFGASAGHHQAVE